MIKILIAFCFIVFADNALSQPGLKLFSTINSIGYQIIIPEGYDNDSTAHIAVKYSDDNSLWKDAFPPTRLMIDSVHQWRGSLFFLKANSRYHLQITITDSFPTYRQDVFQDSIYTGKEPNIQSSSIIKYVSPNGSGTIYSFADPGNLRTLLTSGVDCGITVMLRGGAYDVGEMNLALHTDCSEGLPIVLMAAPGETPILDGGDHTQYTWTKTASDTNMYSTSIKPELEYNALCLFDSLRLYPYAFLTPNSLDPQYPALSNLGYELSGFYRKGNVAYIKTLNNTDPNKANIIFSKHFSCLAVDGNSKNNYLQLKGITLKYYNKGQVDKDVFGNPTAAYPSNTLSFTNCNHIIIDSCRFEYSNFPITFNGTCNNNIVQRCSIIDGTGYWSHGAFKQTRDINYLEPGSYGRYLENAGIFFSPGNDITISGNSIRNNSIKGVVSGLGLGFGQTYRMTEFDISGNDISYCYDGIDATSACINTRIWNNTVGYSPVAISLILPTFGPMYILRNVLHHISDRKNFNNDVFFVECNNTITNTIWGTGLKLNAGGDNALPGSIYFIHNTLHSQDTLGFNMYLWNPTWKKLYSRNNIYYSEGKANFLFDGISGDSLYSFDSQNDDYFNVSTHTVAIIRPVHGITGCESFSDPDELGKRMAVLTNSKDVHITGLSADPTFTSLIKNNFHLSTNSPLIDHGLIIPGINDDYKNSAPDIGAFETERSANFIRGDKTIDDNFSFDLWPNPSQSQLHIRIDDRTRVVKLYDLFGREIIYHSTIDAGLLTVDVSNFCDGIYIAEIWKDGKKLRKKWVKQ